MASSGESLHISTPVTFQLPDVPKRKVQRRCITGADGLALSRFLLCSHTSIELMMAVAVGIIIHFDVELGPAEGAAGWA